MVESFAPLRSLDTFYHFLWSTLDTLQGRLARPTSASYISCVVEADWQDIVKCFQPCPRLPLGFLALRRGMDVKNDAQEEGVRPSQPAETTHSCQNVPICEGIRKTGAIHARSCQIRGVSR